MKRFFIGLCTLLITLTTFAGLQKKDGDIKNPDVFGIRFENDKREFYGRVAAINSVSLQEYVTTHFKVAEMNIDFSGSNTQLRIFHVRPLDQSDLQDSIQQVVPNGMNVPSGQSVGAGMVNKASETAVRAANSQLFKQFPATTHAKTVEFQVQDYDAMVQLYQKVRNAWIQAEGQDFASSGETKPDEESLSGALFVFTDKE